MSAERVAALEDLLARVQKNREEPHTSVRRVAAPAEPEAPRSAVRRPRTQTPLEQAMSDSVELELPSTDESPASEPPDSDVATIPPAAPEPQTFAKPESEAERVAPPPPPVPRTSSLPPVLADPDPSPEPVALALDVGEPSGPVARAVSQPQPVEPQTFGEIVRRALALRPR
jgi:hypothetical protein